MELISNFHFLFNFYYTKIGVLNVQRCKRICPHDSDCTCLTLYHRSIFTHSAEIGYIKGRDRELSAIQTYYATHLSEDNCLICIPMLD